jgi:sulfite reductase (NADPH) flavoprotein alpha-component
MIKTPLAGFDDDLLKKLVGGLDSQQQIWLSGFLYGVAVSGQAAAPALAEASRAQTVAESVPAAAAVPAPVAPVAVKPRVTVLYGSQSGNSKGLAKKIFEKAQAKGFVAGLQDMNDYNSAQLKQEQYLLVVVATYGEGEPPVSAETLHKFIHSTRAPKLPGLKYGVLALGDRSYAQFCQTGIDFDEKLADLGGSRLLDRVDCDTDFEEEAEAWIEKAIQSIATTSGATDTALLTAAANGATHASRITHHASLNGNASSLVHHTSLSDTDVAPAVVYDRKNPFPATILEKIQMNGRGSAKETWHLELSLEGSGLTYKPGDALGVWPTNPPETVVSVLKATRLLATEKVDWHGTWMPLGEVLTYHAELQLLSKDVLEKIYNKVRAPRLQTILQDVQALRQYIYGRDLADVLSEFSDLWSADAFVKILRRLQPRLYSIASSLEQTPDEVHLTVGAVRYEAFGRNKRGAASSFLADTLSVGDQARVFIETNEYFKLPADPSANIIMVGPGTGIAPFRAFVQERQAQGAPGKNWLFFGNPHFATDFLYQLEWQQALKKGDLAHLDVAFSRDQDKKVYVQHKLLAQSKRVFEWLEQGAYFYVCGDKNRMAGDVEKALLEIVAQEGKLSSEQAAEYVKNMKKTRRYLEDVY